MHRRDTYLTGPSVRGTALREVPLRRPSSASPCFMDSYHVKQLQFSSVESSIAASADFLKNLLQIFTRRESWRETSKVVGSI